MKFMIQSLFLIDIENHMFFYDKLSISLECIPFACCRFWERDISCLIGKVKYSDGRSDIMICHK